jgi:hypothetical protein
MRTPGSQAIDQRSHVTFLRAAYGPWPLSALNRIFAER